MHLYTVHSHLHISQKTDDKKLQLSYALYAIYISPISNPHAKKLNIHLKIKWCISGSIQHLPFSKQWTNLKFWAQIKVAFVNGYHHRQGCWENARETFENIFWFLLGFFQVISYHFLVHLEGFLGRWATSKESTELQPAIFFIF